MPVVGWVVGVVALWTRHCWNLRTKVLATLVWPLSALLISGFSALWYWLLLPLKAPYSSLGTSLFLLVPNSWLVALLLVGRWLYLTARPIPATPRDIR
ncbi:hypothetical protein GCM10012275_13130 [Longimycelium tulufanense]|uniref:Uncharacterized protein n=1 Tax=Longimycelium tulufanense TaxID=907463 RepID=A0A8J3FTS5_9PSEU|nr:hypothetical protein [Longimycelium tulufanense]GGM43532.1 hypothetical protein GCM10012275_13130 [Longimycelium tulufanense]